MVSFRRVVKVEITMAPKTATAISAAILDTALLTPEAAPENRGSTDNADLVSGAMTRAMPMPNSTSPGKNCLK